MLRAMGPSPVAAADDDGWERSSRSLAEGCGWFAFDA